MADVTQQLTDRYSAVKHDAYSTEVVTTDGGEEFRNARWAAPLATWDVVIPFCSRSSTHYSAVVALFAATLGSLRTFTFHDKVACADYEVRLVDDTLSFTPNGNLVQIEFSVKEVRASGDSP